LERKKKSPILNTGFGIAKGAFLFSLCLILLYPLLIMISISLRRADEIFDPAVIWIPKSISFSAFTYIFKELNYLNVVFLTGRISVISSICQLFACSLAGYAFAKYEFRLKKTFFILLMLTIIVPPQISALPTSIYFRFFDFFGLSYIPAIFTGTPATVSLINKEALYYVLAGFGGGIKSGLCVFIFIQFFKGLPKELTDAASIDGCGRLSTFIRIVIPCSKPPFLTVFIFSLVWYWNDYYTNSLFFDDLVTVSRSLKDINATLSTLMVDNIYERIPQIQAAAFLFILPILIVYILLQKYFTESIERTGIVG